MSVTETQMEHDERESRLARLMTRWTVPAIPVLVGMIILTLGVAFAFWQQKQDRLATAEAIGLASCQTQREFRAFFTDYLESQIGTPIDQIPGFDQLTPEAREFALQLEPVIEAERQEDQQALATYIVQFPIPNCDN